MTKEVEIHGTLENWRPYYGRIIGNIYNDTKGRFADGAEVMTSIMKHKEGNIAFTMNSNYKLGKPFDHKGGTERPTEKMGDDEFENYLGRKLSLSANQVRNTVRELEFLGIAGVLPDSFVENVNRGR